MEDILSIVLISDLIIEQFKRVSEFVIDLIDPSYVGRTSKDGYLIWMREEWHHHIKITWIG